MALFPKFFSAKPTGNWRIGGLLHCGFDFSVTTYKEDYCFINIKITTICL